MAEIEKVRVDITEYFDEFTSYTTVWLSEKQRQDITFIELFYAESYEKSFLHKAIRFLQWIYRKEIEQLVKKEQK